MPRINKPFEALEAEVAATLRAINSPVREFESVTQIVSLLTNECDKLKRQNDSQTKIIENLQNKINEQSKKTQE